MHRHGAGWAVLLAGWLLVGCGGTSTDGEGSGGGASGGAPVGGSGTGGAATTGGSNSGGSATGGSSSGGTATGGAVTGGSSSGGATTGGTGGGGAMMGCYVGIQLDDCCSPPVAADELWEADPCVVPYDTWLGAAERAACPASEQCLMLNCVHPQPASRVVTRDATGTCVFTDECDPSDIDCEVAVDHNRCCSCPEVMPRRVVESDPCVLPVSQPPPGGCADCSTVDCAACPGEPLIPSCGYRGNPSFTACMAAIP